jgi:D-methionine transport system ATP-binding protein
VIRIENLSKTYTAGRQTVTALNDISFEVGKGEIFGIIGRSGAGKSTLIRTLNLLERPSQGKVVIDGNDLTALPQRELPVLRQRIGMVFQHFNLLQSKTVAQNIAFPLKLAGIRDKAAIHARVDELLDLVGLGAFRDSYPSRLSGGQKQRVGIARALANKPGVLLSDEATSALDPETTASILELLADINQKLGLTIVLITHEMSVIRTLCDRVAVLDHGRIVESGNVADVFLHPQHEVTRSLLAEGGIQTREAYEALRRHSESLLLRLTFVGDETYEPALSRVTSETGLHFNILQGTIGRIKHTPYGQLLVETAGQAHELQQALNLLTRWDIRHEVLV